MISFENVCKIFTFISSIDNQFLFGLIFDILKLVFHDNSGIDSTSFFLFHFRGHKAGGNTKVSKILFKSQKSLEIPIVTYCH